MKYYADQRRTERQFGVGCWVYVKLQPFRQISLRGSTQHKFSPKYYGPFQIQERIGEVAYRLLLPSTSQIHPVFHVSQLKQRKGDAPDSAGTIPPIDTNSVLAAKPIKILARRMVKRNNRPDILFLIHWQGANEEDATWERAADIMLRYPEFDVMEQHP
ncbi:uncharacterized protein [Rutidosis leptorrhynchoides]|uniref:uncharacterized protein n=1 Tax=Rutidosis leptorrhynchoides TaxID=125765 RepID=UPI003A998CAB